MATNLQAVEAVVRKYVRDVRMAMPIDKAILFGSHVKGMASKHSDIDICFFSNDFSSKRSVDVVTDLLGIAGKYRDVCFDPKAFPTSEIYNDNPFVKEVLRTGREII